MFIPKILTWDPPDLLSSSVDQDKSITTNKHQQMTILPPSHLLILLRMNRFLIPEKCRKCLLNPSMYTFLPSREIFASWFTSLKRNILPCLPVTQTLRVDHKYFIRIQEKENVSTFLFIYLRSFVRIKKKERMRRNMGWGPVCLWHTPTHTDTRQLITASRKWWNVIRCRLMSHSKLILPKTQRNTKQIWLLLSSFK